MSMGGAKEPAGGKKKCLVQNAIPLQLACMVQTVCTKQGYVDTSIGLGVKASNMPVTLPLGRGQGN